MIDFQKRLNSLKERRHGIQKISALESFGIDSADLGEIEIPEFFENLKESVGVKYTIGAMAPVEKRYTDTSINEGNRVANSLTKALNNDGEFVIAKLQGSVALDIHIKGHSDVDMLIIVRDTINVETPVLKNYLPATDPRNLVDIAKDVRIKSERILKSNFPQVTVGCTGNKSITLEGGSLTRKVDIVPAVWFDSIEYQRSEQEHDRGIKIYHKDEHNLILNYPFKHMKMINERDTQFAGNLKCVIRLLKNMIADMPDYKKRIAKKLSSYDLAAIVFHMNNDLYAHKHMRLSLVEKTRAHLDSLHKFKHYRDALDVPDGSRKIFDNDEKSEALEILKSEITELAESIYRELVPSSTSYDPNAILRKTV